MKLLAKKIIAEKRQKALEMANKPVSKLYESKAISINEEAHTAIFVMSTAHIDRYGDIVDQDSWILQYFEQNPFFGWQHQSDDFPLGRWLRVWFEDDPELIGQKRMLGEAYFAVDIDERAARAWAHVKDGNLRAVSVGFIPHQVDYDEDRDAFILTKNELLECSLVGTQANRQSLIKEAVELSEIKSTLIEQRNALNAKLKDEDVAVLKNIRALELLSKSIRQLRV